MPVVSPLPTLLSRSCVRNRGQTPTPEDQNRAVDGVTERLGLESKGHALKTNVAQLGSRLSPDPARQRPADQGCGWTSAGHCEGEFDRAGTFRLFTKPDCTGNRVAQRAQRWRHTAEDNFTRRKRTF